MKIALINIATNKYSLFLKSLYQSADYNFFPDENVNYVLFTNNNVDLSSKNKIIKIPIEHKPWPYMTLYRYKFFDMAKDILKEYDYVYYCDVDMLFVNRIKEDIISDLVGTLHGGFYDKPKHTWTYETNPKSTAYIKNGDGDNYYCGGFNGGSSQEFLKMSAIINENITIDEKNNIIAKWHDESHINKYFYINKPTKILSAEYCWPDTNQKNDNAKIIALTKDNTLFKYG